MCKENEDKKQKTYSSFESLTEICDTFDYYVKREFFLEEIEYEINPFFRNMLIEDFTDLKNYTSEFVICEALIRPIISEVSKHNKLPLWSHVKFDVDKELGLTGEADYLWALPNKSGEKYSHPVICLGEAKRDDFVKGWAQVGAEMIAAQKANKTDKVPIYGLVSTGGLWQFGKLVNNTFTLDPNAHSSPAELEKIFNTLNWFFSEARKSADLLKANEEKEN